MEENTTLFLTKDVPRDHSLFVFMLVVERHTLVPIRLRLIPMLCFSSRLPTTLNLFPFHLFKCVASYPWLYKKACHTRRRHAQRQGLWVRRSVPVPLQCLAI